MCAAIRSIVGSLIIVIPVLLSALDCACKFLNKLKENTKCVLIRDTHAWSEENTCAICWFQRWTFQGWIVSFMVAWSQSGTGCSERETSLSWAWRSYSAKYNYWNKNECVKRTNKTHSFCRVLARNEHKFRRKRKWHILSETCLIRMCVCARSSRMFSSDYIS